MNGTVQKFLEVVTRESARGAELGGFDGVAQSILQDVASIGFEVCAGKDVPMPELKSAEQITPALLLWMVMALYKYAKYLQKKALKIRSCKGFRLRVEAYCTTMMQFIGLNKLMKERTGESVDTGGCGIILMSIRRRLGKVREVLLSSEFLEEYRSTQRHREWNSLNEPTVTF